MKINKIAIVTCVVFIISVFSSTFVSADKKDESEVIELTFADNNVPVAPGAKAVDTWIAEVEKLTEGRVKINVYHASVLLKENELYRGVQSYVADMGMYVLNGREGFTLNTIMALPFMGWPSQTDSAKIYKDLLATFPEMVAEWEGIKVLAVMTMPPTAIHTVKKEVRTPGDLKGIKMHCAENALSQAIGEAGGTPLQLPITDMYMSLDRGLIQGVMNHFPVLSVFGVLEILKNHTLFGEGGITMGPMMVIMNADRLNKLPPDIQKIIKDSAYIWEDVCIEMDRAMQQGCVNDAKKWGHNFVNLTHDEMKVWYDLVKGPIHDKWIEENEKKGLPGQAVYNEALRLIKEY